MQNMKHMKIKLTISWFAVILCMLLIFYLSNQQAYVSNGESKGIIKQGVDIAANVINPGISETEKLNIIDQINSIAREYMHGVVFLVLGLLVFNAVRRSKEFLKKYKVALISIAICIVYALSDEIHQIFIPGRAFQLSDLTMDTAGSIVGIGVIWLISNFKARGKNGPLKTAR
ncbi:MAG: VanZ family protein [Clostridia bacterium]|jgi:VanZ family protein